MGIYDAIFRITGQSEIHRLITISSTGGSDTSGIPPTRVVKQERVHGHLVPATEELLVGMGYEVKADAVLYTTTQLDLDDGVLFDGTTYEVVEEFTAPFYLGEKVYRFVLLRVPDMKMNTVDDPGKADVGFNLVLEIADDFDIADSIGTVAGLGLSVSDSLAVAESIETAAEFVLALSDILNVTDAVATEAGFVLAMNDSIGTVESITIAAI